MPDLDQPRINLLKLIAEHETDLSNVSQAINRNHAYLHQYIKRGSPRQLGENERTELGRYFNVSPDVFRSNANSLSANGASAGLEKKIMAARQTDIPEYDIAAAAGHGNLPIAVCEEDGLRAIDHWSLPRRYLSAFSENPDSLAVIKVAGDSMEPEYQAGERVLVDRSHILPSPPGVYVLWDGLGLVLKRVEVIFGSEDPMKVRISSINGAYGTYERALDEVHINGRVIGKWQWK